MDTLTRDVVELTRALVDIDSTTGVEHATALLSIGVLGVGPSRAPSPPQPPPFAFTENPLAGFVFVVTTVSVGVSTAIIWVGVPVLALALLGWRVGARLERQRVPTAPRNADMQWQLFFDDPNGAKVELDFDKDERAPA